MSERFIPEHRRTQFKAKNTFKPDELRRRREEQQVEIRKAKREENLAKRRGIAGRDGTQMSAPGASLGASIDSDDEGGTIESQVRYACLVVTSSHPHLCIHKYCSTCEMRLAQFLLSHDCWLLYRIRCLCLFRMASLSIAYHQLHDVGTSN